MDSENFNFLDDSTFGGQDSFKYFSSKQEGELLPKDFDKFEFKYAPISDPSKFTEQIKSSDGKEKEIMDMMKGTTTLGFKYKGGIIIAVDSRGSMGSFVGSEHVRKVLEINDYLLGTMAGGAADCQFWERVLGMEVRLYELRNGQRPSVAAASRILGNIVYNYRGYGLSMGTMVAGWDISGANPGPHLYYIDDDGTRVEGKLFSVGSGSTYAYGILDSKYNFEMSDQEAYEIARQAIYHATYRDSGSGGVCRVYHIHANGWTKIEEGVDVNELHYKYAQEKGLRGDGDETREKIL